MRGIGVGLICFIVLLLPFIKMTPDSPYDQYRSWFDEEIAAEMDEQLKVINKKIKRKKIKVEDYSNLAKTYEDLLIKALEKNETNKAQQHLVEYLRLRTNYHLGYVEYFQTKDQLKKAQLNNIYDDGNVEYQLFLNDLEEFAKVHNEKFRYPFILY
jgi:hypothetical protein